MTNFMNEASQQSTDNQTIDYSLQTDSPADLFVHHVYFFLKNPDSETDKAQLLDGLNKLAAVPTIKFAHIGQPAATNRAVIERGYSVSWLCLFDTATDEAVYQQHPIHLKFVADCAGLWEKVIVYDSVGPRRS